MSASLPPTLSISVRLRTERPQVEVDRRLYLLARVDLFQMVDLESLEKVAASLTTRLAAAGEVICRTGDPADAFYVVESGSLDVLWESRGKQHLLRRLGPGDAFGEIALLRGGVRSATVRAESDVQLWALSSARFQELCDGSPWLSLAVERLARGRERDSQRLALDAERGNVAVLTASGASLRIGRRPDNDIVFSSRIVSGYHAVIERIGEEFRLRDLDSSNGTFVNGRAVSGSVTLADGDEIWIGEERLIFDRTALRRTVEPRGLRIDATELIADTRSGRRLLNGISFSILPGEFVAILGGSGAGKSTLMEALVGSRPASGGRVSYNGVDYYRHAARFRTSLGYVPQDDIIHRELPLRSVLGYAARLRLPLDMRADEREAVVDAVLYELGLSDRKQVRVSALSGGQRKRASIAVELLTKPRAFFLDEPTSGLDPATEKQMMEVLRGLADAGSTVVLTTHTTKNIGLCDKVVVLAPGGYLAFAGTPARARRYFGVDDFDEIYSRLEERPAQEWADVFRASNDYAALLGEQLPAEPGAAPARPMTALARHGRGFLSQLLTLVARNWALFVADRREVITILAQPVLIPLFMLAVFRAHPFRLDTNNPRVALIILYFLVSSGLLFGIAIAIREIVKDYSIFRRERMVNLAIVPYVLSKALVMAPFLLLSEALMVLVLWLAQRMPERGPDVYAPLLAVLALNVLAAMGLGLFVSVLVSSSDQASRLVPILLVPQLLFSGALLSIPAMVPAGRVIARLMISKWALDASGHAADLNGLFKHGTSPLAAAMLNDYGDSFSADVALAMGVLAGFLVLMLVLTCVALERKSSRR